MDTKDLITQAERGNAKSQLALGRALLVEDYPHNISDSAVYWLEKAADASDASVSMPAVKELVKVYPVYNATKSAEKVLERLEKFAERKNPVALLELGRIYFGDNGSAYLQKFDFKGKLLPPLSPKKHYVYRGFSMVHEAAEISEKMGRATPFDSTHFYVIAEIYAAWARITKVETGRKNKYFQSLLDRYLHYAKKADAWASDNYVRPEHKKDCAALVAFAKKMKAENMVVV